MYHVAAAWVPQYKEIEVHALFLTVVGSETILIGSSRVEKEDSFNGLGTSIAHISLSGLQRTTSP